MPESKSPSSTPSTPTSPTGPRPSAPTPWLSCAPARQHPTRTCCARSSTTFAPAPTCLTDRPRRPVPPPARRSQRLLLLQTATTTTTVLLPRSPCPKRSLTRPSASPARASRSSARSTTTAPPDGAARHHQAGPPSRLTAHLALPLSPLHQAEADKQGKRGGGGRKTRLSKGEHPTLSISSRLSGSIMYLYIHILQ